MRLLRTASLVALVVSFVSAEADAAGLFMAPRGVRPLGRGGAFVAGADDVHALTYNPAGLGFAKNQVLFDLTMQFFSVDFTRRVTADSEPLPTVHGSGLKLPLPNMGFVHDFGLGPMFTFGASLGADIPTLQNWPAQLPDGSPAPQRYSIEEYNGTAIVKLAAGGAIRPVPQLSIGLSLQALVGTFADTKTVSACDGVICTQAEDSLHDTRIQLIAKNIVAPGIHFGVIAAPVEWLKLGVAWESGYHVSKHGKLNVRLPAAGEYDAATLSEDPRATCELDIPWSLRFGIEGHNDLVRVELSAVHDHWSVFDRVTITPQDVQINNVLAIGDYRLAEMFIEPHFHDVWSFRLGSEWTPDLGNGVRDLVLRLGAFYEPSAIPDERLSPEWVDLDKLFITGGGGYRIGKVALDATFALGLLQGRNIRNSAVMQLNPLRPAFEGRTAVGNGDYSASDFIIGVSLRYFLGE